MIRLLVTTEGRTEMAFARTVLAPHLAKYGVFVQARCVLTSKDKRMAREYRGGLLGYNKAKIDIETWLKEDNHPECRFTTMFDLYALPADFPGYAEAKMAADPYGRVKILEQSMGMDISDWRFIPYIQLHEFEALILADPRKLAWEYLEHDIPIKNLIDMVGTRNPELINDGQETAPSKRILGEIPEYDKITAGTRITEKIGIQTLREKCGHFNQWLSILENLAESR
jgi:hypothetical protein